MAETPVVKTDYPPECKQAWLGESADSFYVHKFAGLDGNVCGFYLGPWTRIRCAIEWDDVTCPDCFNKKHALEMAIEHIIEADMEHSRHNL